MSVTALPGGTTALGLLNQGLSVCAVIYTDD